MKFERLAFVQSFYSLVSKFSGYVRDIFLAYFIGASIVADIFFMALRIPVAFKTLLSEETFNAAYIPIFGKISEGGNIEKKYHFAHQLMIATLLIIIPIVILAEIYMPNIVALFSNNIHDQYNLALFIKASRIMFPYVIFIGVSSIFIGTLNTYGRFALSAGLPFIINLSIVCSCFLFPVIPAERVTILSWSVIFGGIFQLIALMYALRGSFFKDLYENLFNLKRDYLVIKSFITLLWPTLLASFLVFFNLIFGIFIASKDIGGVSMLYYSERIFHLPLTLIGISIGIVLLPIMSARSILKDINAIKELQEKAYRYCVLSIFPITLILVFFSETIITLFFYRGVFEIAAVSKSALALKLYLMGLPAAVIVKMLIPYLYATSQPKIALVTILISTLSCIIMTLIFFPRVGFLSVPLALSLASWINMFLLIRAHAKLNSFKLNSSLVMYSFKSLCFAVILFYFLRIVDIELSNYVLNNIYKLVIELLLIVPLFVYFVYKMEVEMYKKMIFILYRLLKKIITL
jgi:putative peptidoglycan lipid II flippase